MILRYLCICVLLCSQMAVAQGSLEFIQNKGQWRGPFEYKASSSAADFYIKKNGFTVMLHDKANKEKIHEYKHGHTTLLPVLNYHAYEMNFIGSNANVQLQGLKPQQHYYNYFLGNDASKWHSNIHPHLAVDYLQLYPNIDAHVYSHMGNIKYDLIVHPGGNPTDVKLHYQGIQGIKVNNNKLYVSTSLGDNMELEPYSYQYINDTKVSIPCQWQVNDNVVSFKLGKQYNPAYELVIDPTVVFCTFTGSTADNWGYTATPGANGQFYAGGIVAGIGYPIYSNGSIGGAVQVNYGGGGVSGNAYGCDIGITKFNSNGTAVIYSTYIGGADNDQPHSIIEDANGNLCILGRTYSNNYPTSSGAFDGSHNGGADIVVTKLNATGTAFVGSTYVGGTNDDCVNFDAGYTTFNDLKYFYGDDSRSEIIVDAQGVMYVAANTKSTNFPTLNPTQVSNGGGQDGVFFIINNNCTALQFSTYIGGTNEDGAYVVHRDSKQPGIVYLAGGTKSSINFLPAAALAGAYHPTYNGGTTDGFVAKYQVNIPNPQLIRATYIGTNAYDQVFGLQDDGNKNLYIMGHTLGAYPVSAGVYSNAGSRQFVQCLDSNLNTSIRSTVFGSGAIAKPNLSLNAFLVDICGNIYISGWGDDGGGATGTGGTNNLPLSSGLNAPFQPTTDGKDFYFIVFTPNLTSLLYATYFGQNGIATNGLGAEHVDGGTSRFDANGVIYQAICANCGQGGVFPTTPGVWSANNPSNNCNLAALKIAFNLINADAISAASPNASGCAPFLVNFINSSTNAQSYWWDFGDGTNTTITAPSHTYNSPGVYNVRLVAINPNGCNGTTDTSFLTITVKADSILNNFTLTKLDSCVTFKIGVNNQSNFYNNSFSGTTTWLWNWGDGTTSNVQNPVDHVYASLGTYTVTLTITDAKACNSPVIRTRVVTFTNNYINGDFTLPDTACIPFAGTFTPITTGVVTGYNWQFGDGSLPVSTTSATHTYPTAGTYTATLIVGNPASCNKFDTSKQVIHIRPDIATDFAFIKLDTCDPYVLGITNLSVANSLYPGAANWTSYVWNWGDGTTSTGKSPGNKTYLQAGTYTITLTMKDSTACNSPQIATKVISFVDNNVRAKLVMPDTGCIPFTYTFNNTSTNATSYLWQFGDGSTANTNAPTHTFGQLGTYTITLIVGNPTSCNKLDSIKHVLTIVPSPVADFVYAPNPPLPNKSVSFTNKSSGAIQYVWDFGDGEGSTEVNPVHLYSVSAETEVCLTAINEYGCRDRKCEPISPRVINIVDVPSGFTPNGDNINDFIQVRGYGIKSLNFQIYNRWGEKIYQSTSASDKWDGKYKGVLQEMEAYSYVLQVTFTDNSNLTKKGNITLIR
jgi:gliding motility-associated-like protein